MSRLSLWIGYALVMASLAVARAADSPEGTPTAKGLPAERDFRPACQPEIRVFPLRFADGKEVVSVLSALFERNERVRKAVWFAPTNTVVVRASKVEAAFMEELVEQIDVAPPESKESTGPPQELRIITVHHAKAAELAEMLGILLVSPGNRRGRDNARWAVDERTNVIAFFATEAQAAAALELVKALDVPLEQPMPKVEKPGK